MSIFDWFGSNKNNDDNTKTAFYRTSRPVVDYTDKLSVNDALTKGIYRNTYPGMKLAGFGFNVINTPVSFMGFPVIATEDDETKEYLQALILAMKREIRSLHTQAHRDGTIWVYPKFRADRGIVWQMIPDQIVTKIVRDLETGDIIQLTTEEEIPVNQLSNDNEITVVKKIVYTTAKVVTTYTGDTVLAGLKNSTAINTAGMIPVNFSNNADVNETRGHSDYERILADLKNYHDVDLAESTVLAKFATKMVQTVKDWSKWSENNGYGADGADIENLDIGSIDLIINNTDEKTEFVHPSDATAGYQSKQKTTFHKLVELSGIPEIAWGLKTEGNLASVEENMAILMQYCQDKQEQKIKPYTQLVNASARLLVAAFELSSVPEDLTVTWDALDATSESTKAEIFKLYAESLAQLVNTAALTKDQLFRMWKLNFPTITEEDFDQFVDGIDAMSAHRSKTNATPEQNLLAQGVVDE